MRTRTMKPTREMISEASVWLIEFRTGNPTQAERDRFTAWLRTSPQHVQAYFEVAAAWSELPDADPEGRIDVQEMMRVARRSGDENVVELGARFKPREARSRSSSSRWLAIAASVLLNAGRSRPPSPPRGGRPSRDRRDGSRPRPAAASAWRRR